MRYRLCSAPLGSTPALHRFVQPGSARLDIALALQSSALRYRALFDTA